LISEAGLRIKSQLLYQLSYAGRSPRIVRKAAGLFQKASKANLSSEPVPSGPVFGFSAALKAWPKARTTPPRPGHNNGGVEDVVRDYIDAIAPEHRALFDRLHRLVHEAHPDAAVVLSYQIPTYKVGRRRLFVAVWKHGVSIYGWEQGRDAGFTARHPEFKTSKGTIQLRPNDAAGIPDDEFRDLVRAALDG
jgi:uncharacterized protein YdhG (YjbR/CyaY superfamily)